MSRRRQGRNPPFGFAGTGDGSGTSAAGGPTELTDYLGVIRDRLPILVLLPAAAVLVVIALVFASARDYRATAIVAAFSLVSGDDAQFGGQNGARQFADTLVGLVESGAIAGPVGERTGVDARKIARNVKASAVGTTGIARITYTTGRQAEAAEVARVAAEEALRAVFKADVSQRLVDESTASLARVQAAIDKLLTDNQLSAADVGAGLLQDQIITLENNLIAAQARADGTGAARYSSALAAKREALRTRTPVIRTYEALSAERSEVVERLGRARSAVDDANARVAASRAPNVVAVGRARVVSPVEEILRKGGLAVGVAAFLAVGIVVASEMGQARRPQSRSARGRRAPARV